MNIQKQKNTKLGTCLILALVTAAGLPAAAQAACVKDGFCDRPIKMGVSISNTPSLPYIYAGTAGMRVRAWTNPNIKFILSNNHVLGAIGPTLCPNTADGWPPPTNWAMQPGTLDIGFDPGKDPTYFAGIDFRYVPLDFTVGASNVVDAALAYTTPSYASTEILGLGQPNPVVGQPTVGMAVTKSGRTSGVTTGSVTAVNSTVNVNYGTGCGVARFIKQAITTASLGTSGDSGSVVLEQGTNTPVGLYFAGSALTGVMNPILEVYRALGVFVDSTAAPVAISEADIVRQAQALPKDPRVEAIKPIQARNESRILAIPGVTGIGIGLGADGKTMGLVVFGEKVTNTLRAAVPATVEGVPVRLVESGLFEAY